MIIQQTFLTMLSVKMKKVLDHKFSFSLHNKSVKGRYQINGKRKLDIVSSLWQQNKDKN